MGRGLSNLQLWILDAALEGRKQRGSLFEREWRAFRVILHHEVRFANSDETVGADLFYGEIKARYFHLETWSENPDLEPLSKYRFRKNQSEGYRAASNTISRAVARLERRGLVEQMHGQASQWAGVNLTQTGSKLAAERSNIVLEKISDSRGLEVIDTKPKDADGQTDLFPDPFYFGFTLREEMSHHGKKSKPKA